MPHAAKEVTIVRKKDWGPQIIWGRFSVHSTPNPTRGTDSTAREAKGIPRGTQLSLPKISKSS